jgi:hypothetical protein
MKKRGRPSKKDKAISWEVYKAEKKIADSRSFDTDTLGVMSRVSSNLQTERDLIFLGQKIEGFKHSDMWPVLTTLVDMLIKDKLTRGKEGSASSDDLLGFMSGCQAVIDKINAFEITGMAVELRNKEERKQKASEDTPQEDIENLEPQQTITTNVGI